MADSTPIFSSKPFRLFDLPVEVRFHIYAFLLPFPLQPCNSQFHPPHILTNRGSPWIPVFDDPPFEQIVALLLVNRTLHHEIQEHLHRHTLFKFCHVLCFRRYLELMYIVHPKERPSWWLKMLARVEFGSFHGLECDCSPRHTYAPPPEQSIRVLVGYLRQLGAVSPELNRLDQNTALSACPQVIELTWPRLQLWQETAAAESAREAMQNIARLRIDGNVAMQSLVGLSEIEKRLRKRWLQRRADDWVATSALGK